MEATVFKTNRLRNISWALNWRWAMQRRNFTKPSVNSQCRVKRFTEKKARRGYMKRFSCANVLGRNQLGSQRVSYVVAMFYRWIMDETQKPITRTRTPAKSMNLGIWTYLWLLNSWKTTYFLVSSVFDHFSKIWRPWVESPQDCQRKRRPRYTVSYSISTTLKLYSWRCISQHNSLWP